MSNLVPQGPSSGPGNFLAGIPPAEEERTPIGSPSAFVAPTGKPFDPSRPFSHISEMLEVRRPRYFAGDQKAPGYWGGEAIRDLQRKLEAAGLLDPGDYQVGVYDRETEAAYTSILAHANLNNMDVNSAISDLQSRINQFGRTTKPSGPTREPLVINITNPDQIAELASQVAVRTIGRRLSPEEANRYAQSYNELERSFQQQRYEMAGSGLPGGPGGEVVDPGSPATYTETQIRQNNPEEVSQQNYRGNFNSFLSLLNKDFG